MILRILIIVIVLIIAVPQSHCKLFENSYAIIVGVNDYSSIGLKKLQNAESDAIAIKNYFKAQGYNIFSLIGSKLAIKRKIENAVQKISSTISERDRFVFFFAGHGKTKNVEDLDIAYLVVMGGQDSEDPESLISTGDINKYSLLVDKAHHQLFIFDSCYSGLMGHFHNTRDDNSKLIYNSDKFMEEALSSRKARQFLSAGGPDQKVLDSGPAGMSWFTYFLLKGLEQGVVKNRQNGLITFRELSSFVQGISANPVHTPSAGSLARHQGGEFLFYSTLKGKPQLPNLPNITYKTLYDLGFLTRSSNPDFVYQNIYNMRKPIELLFRAWIEKDFNLYMKQFHPDIIMTGRYKSGRTYSRGYKDIEKHRRKQFLKLLKRAEVDKYEVMYQGSDGKYATFGVRYSMNFYWKNNKISKEKNINECYKVTQLPDSMRWVIIRNDDYQQKMCKY